jgi:hypothetical protein
MAANDLTSLTAVKQWLGVENPNSDQVLLRLITNVSAVVRSQLARDTLSLATYKEVRDGHGGHALFLRNFPVLSLTSLVVADQTIVAYPPNSPAPQPAVTLTPYGVGYQLEPWDGQPPGRPQGLSIVGGTFARGRQNVTINYQAGYVIQNEAGVVLNASYAVLQPYGSYTSDVSVSYASGQALTRVASNPGVGQYVPPTGIQSAPSYAFSAQDEGQSISVSYSYVPADLEQAVLELVGERYRYRDRIGLRSKSVGGHETISYDTSDMPKWVDMVLQPYRNVVTW